jgi:hypothetical protein
MTTGRINQVTILSLGAITMMYARNAPKEAELVTRRGAPKHSQQKTHNILGTKRSRFAIQLPPLSFSKGSPQQSSLGYTPPLTAAYTFRVEGALPRSRPKADTSSGLPPGSRKVIASYQLSADPKNAYYPRAIGLWLLSKAKGDRKKHLAHGNAPARVDIAHRHIGNKNN